MTDPCTTDAGPTRRERISRLGHVENCMLGALLQGEGTATVGAVASSLASALEEYHSEVLAYIGELALAGHAETPAKDEGAE